MAYAAYSPLTVTGSLGSYTRFPFYQTEGWPLAEHVCEGIIAQSGRKEKGGIHFARLQRKNGPPLQSYVSGFSIMLCASDNTREKLTAPGASIQKAKECARTHIDRAVVVVYTEVTTE